VPAGHWVTSPIIGPCTLEQFQDNLKAVEVKITDEDRKQVDKLSPPGKAIIDQGQGDFSQSLYRF
jgi:aryl-alcohol dehydrogenase-like predicted oxidoreductase